MSIEKDRLISLIDFAHQSARMKTKIATTVAEHGHFALHEDQLRSMPGVSLNRDTGDSDDEIWLAIQRLRETSPPPVTSAVLAPWVAITQSSSEPPRLKVSLDGASLIKAGTHSSATGSQVPGKPLIEPDARVSLPDYDQAAQVQSHFSAYLSTKWRPWAEEEQLRRKSIRLYAQLFTLKQHLEGGIVETPLELIWGAGIGIWKYAGSTMNYPLVARLVELTLNPDTAEIEIRPRDIDPRLELDWYAAHDNPGVPPLEKAAREFVSKATTTFSPFDRGSFEPLLRTAVTHLDANGIYWPDVVPPEDRAVPQADDKLKITDTWVLFARPRTNNLLLQDLEKLRKQTEHADGFPPAVVALVSDPDTANPVIELPSFRGVSGTDQNDGAASSKQPRDLFFPKPFNDEQVRIIQLLEVSDGVVVQGPPGTGKTHTIANVICHYLAEGKRVLVTSMKDPALTVLNDQLPAEIRPLAISLLTSEQDGMKQFEHAIQKIATEVQSLDRAATVKTVRQLEETIASLHGRLAAVDRKIGKWANRNLSKIALDGQEIDPQDAARETVSNEGQCEWLPDAIDITPEFEARFNDADVVRLRDARRVLAADINLLNASLPQLVELPDSRSLVQVHQDLSQLEKLKQRVEDGVVPPLADASAETLDRARTLLERVDLVRKSRSEFAAADRPWTGMIRERIRRCGTDDLLATLEALGAELEQAIERRKAFLVRPVAAQAGIEQNSEVMDAVNKLTEGKNPFGLKGLFGMAEQRRQVKSIRVLGTAPTTPESWRHVFRYLSLLKTLRVLAVRWNALASELGIELVAADTPSDGLRAAELYSLYKSVKAGVREEGELARETALTFPNWLRVREISTNPDVLCEVESAVQHHITNDRLASVWIHREKFQKALDGRRGQVIDSLRKFLQLTLGNPAVSDSAMQASWTALTAELSRMLALESHLATVRDVCGLVEASGAPKYAALLRQPMPGTVDTLLPDSWRSAWRVRRLTTYLASIDAHDELKRLAAERTELEAALSRGYSDIVVKRTWLKLAENASPAIRAALQAYLNAIRKIGKGTGKRAVRFRQDARSAASLANPAVPCWIMPHYRVSESLPAELGCFDLLVIDEASQSDLTALPSLLRAKKVLIVGDDKQVSPEGVGIDEEKVRNLMNRFLGSQVETFRPQMTPERSVYDLLRVVFATSTVMLKEHFRCVGSIIEYSKREFYNHELRPLRVPRASERLDPPLIDILVEDGYRQGDVNHAEARFIVDEIKSIVSDPAMSERSVGVVSLLANKQALLIWDRLTDELGPEIMRRHNIACGDARTFQGKERDIMFLSMVSAPNEIGAPLSRDTFAQRFNVAASRARDRMYLVRSVEPDQLSAADALRRSLIAHFASPFAQDQARVDDLRKLCESPFEREVYDELTQRGYRVTPQVRAGQYRIDMVVEGHNDARLAIECDGDKYHGEDRWVDDMRRQRVLERAGWVFWRCFASAFIRRRQQVVNDLLKTLAERGIEPIGTQGATVSVHAEHRTVSAAELFSETIVER